MKSCRSTAFTLIELLVVVAIIVILVALLLPNVKTMLERGNESKSLANLKQIGNAVSLYANDNDLNLPSRVMNGDKWPALLYTYLGNDKRAYAEPNNPKNYIRMGTDPLSSSKNNTSYVLNGFNDQGTLGEDGVGGGGGESIAVKMTAIQEPANTILMTAQDYHPDNFYMDYGLGEHNRMLNLERYRNLGSYYLFADGSARFISKDEYRHELWLVNKSETIPQ